MKKFLVILRNLLENVAIAIYTYSAKAKVASCGQGLHVYRPCLFSSRTHIGNNCHFNGMRISGDGNVFIGNNLHSGKNIRILTSNHNYDFGQALPYDDTQITKDVTISDNVWLGEHVMILPGVTIGEGSVIQAGSVVVTSIPPFSIAGGHPCRPFKQRNIEHYNKLKNEEKFY